MLRRNSPISIAYEHNKRALFHKTKNLLRAEHTITFFSDDKGNRLWPMITWAVKFKSIAVKAIGSGEIMIGKYRGIFEISDIFKNIWHFRYTLWVKKQAL